MHIKDVFNRDHTTFSFEFFPPRNKQGGEALFENIAELDKLGPSFVSVTYGAGGATREMTADLVTRLRHERRITAIPHLTCVCHDQQDIEQIAGHYAEQGVSNILALAGDVPHNRQGWDRSKDAFRHAAELVRYLKTADHPDPRGFGIGVAGFPQGHPDTPNRLREMDYLKAKVDAGADWICTQLFFDNHAFLDFRDRCELAGINVPIIAGIMPIVSRANMLRMAELSGGTHFPAPLMRAIERCGDNDEAVASVGLHWATHQCFELLNEKVDGIHFYTLNQSTSTRRIFEMLGAGNARQLRG